jgi:hypothetical protein
LTPEEKADEEATGEDLPDRAERVLVDAGAEISGIAWQWVGSHRSVVVTVKGDHEQFRPVLDAWPDGDRVVLEASPYSRKELQALADRIVEDLDELEALGIDLSTCGAGTDCVELRYFAGDREPAEQVLSSRYGPALKAEWIGPSRMAQEPHPFGSWVGEGTTLTVFYALPHNGEQPGTCTAAESEEKIVVSLTVLAPQGVSTLIGGYKPSHATVLLSSPVGDRTVIDAAHNLPRPRWHPRTQLRLP